MRIYIRTRSHVVYAHQTIAPGAVLIAIEVDIEQQPVAVIHITSSSEQIEH